MTEHVLTKTLVEEYSSKITPDGVTEDINSMDVFMEHTGNATATYECSCGRRFRKDETAHEHLLEAKTNA